MLKCSPTSSRIDQKMIPQNVTFLDAFLEAKKSPSCSPCTPPTLRICSTLQTKTLFSLLHVFCSFYSIVNFDQQSITFSDFLNGVQKMMLIWGVILGSKTDQKRDQQKVVFVDSSNAVGQICMSESIKKMYTFWRQKVKIAF